MTDVTAVPPWWQDSVIYQVYVRSFVDGDGDGVGDLYGLLARLPYLTDILGVEAVWLSPCYPSPLRDYGYDVSDFTTVDPALGGLDAFDSLVEACHRRGLRVIIDWVPNHTSDQHEWFRRSRSSRTDEHRDWYYWRDPSPDGREPNNWISEVGGPTWTWDEPTGQYYMHSFQATMPDLNWRNPAVVEAMLQTLTFWLDRNVDGVRIDVAHLLGKDPQLRDNPPAVDRSVNMADIQHPSYTTQLHVHDRGHEDVLNWHRDIRVLVDQYGASGHERVTIGEIEVLPVEHWMRYYGSAADGLHMPFNFHLIESPWTAGAIDAKINELEAGLPATCWLNYVIGNHDRPRVATRYGQRQARVAAMLLLTVRGTPVIYYGDELGLTDAPQQGVPLDVLGRDAVRTPMPWSHERHHGFCPDTTEPWLPFHPDSAKRNVASQLNEPRSLLNLYRSLISLRRTCPSLRSGSYRSLGPNGSCLLYLREGGGERLVIALNLGSQAEHVELPGPGRTLLSTELDGPPRPTTDTLAVRPDEGIVVRLSDGIEADGQ